MGLANRESWEKAIALHAEMNSKGLELPASELLEFIEVGKLVLIAMCQPCAYCLPCIRASSLALHLCSLCDRENKK